MYHSTAGSQWHRTRIQWGKKDLPIEVLAVRFFIISDEVSIQYGFLSQVLALLEQIEESHARGSLERPIALTSGQRQQLQRIRRVAAVLETTLMRLDGDIMLLGSF